MALWGDSDSLYSTGTVSVNTGVDPAVATFAGGATLPAAGTIEGAVLTCSDKGSAVILERTGNTTCTLVGIAGLTAAVSGQTYNISEQPKYLPDDPNWDGDEIFGVSEAEQQTARTNDSKYRPAHAGWVGITSYTDDRGNLRIKTEVFVAGSNITGDAADDVILPDS
jgi:hypothetical protein